MNGVIDFARCIYMDDENHRVSLNENIHNDDYLNVDIRSKVLRSLKCVFIPAACETIPDSCFAKCFILSNVTFASGCALREISKDAFSECRSLRDIEIPASVEVIGDNCFSFCASLSRVKFANSSSLKRIGMEAFRSCTSLEILELPASIEEIGEGCFNDCTISSLSFPEENNFFTVVDSLVICNDGVRIIGCFNSDITEIEIPANIEEIEASCFCRFESLSSVTFASGSVLKRIGDYAFSECESLRSIKIPASVEEIKNNCFCECSALSRVVFAKGSVLKRIGKYAFSECTSIEKIKIPASVEEIGEKCFMCNKGDSSLFRVTFASGSVLKRIGDEAFRYCDSLEEIILPVSVQEIGSGCFSNCNMLSLIFSGKSKWFTVLDSLLLCKDGMRAICCFYCEIEEIEIPAKVKEIGANCFSGCSLLCEVTFESQTNLKRIGHHAFSGCGSLDEIELPMSVEEIGEGCFNDCDISWLSWAKDSKWFTTLYPLLVYKDGMRAICPFTSELEEMKIPASVEEIGENCFSGCTSIYSVTFETGSVLKRIAKGAFGGCRELREIQLPESLEEIDDDCFSSCDSIYDVTFASEGVLKRIGNEAFSRCADLQEIEIPASVEEIGERCFSGCVTLSHVTFASESVLKRIGNQAFYACIFLKEIEIPASVEEIGEKCFNITFLSGIKLASGSVLKRISSDSFYEV